MKDTILYGDCRETLKEFNGEARMCVTSPPYYGLRNYGGEEDQIGLEQTPEEYVDSLVKVFREVRNCLTDDGYCACIKKKVPNFVYRTQFAQFNSSKKRCRRQAEYYATT